ncbi:hypothetical protein D3C81_1248970 [compost metagenome]
MNHAPAQFLGVAHGLRSRAFVGQLADHQFEAVEVGNHGHAQRSDFFGLHVATEEFQAIGRCVGEPLAHGIVEHRGQTTRPEHRTNHGGDSDAEENLFGARLCYVPHRQRVIHHRQGNQRQGVTGEHQCIVVGRAQLQGQEQQNARPQRDDYHQHIRALHEHRHEKNRRRGTEKSPDGAV